MARPAVVVRFGALRRPTLADLRLALLNARRAEALGARFVAWIDDGAGPAPVDGIPFVRDLQSLGFAPDETILRSDRRRAHAAALCRLEAAGRVGADGRLIGPFAPVRWLDRVRGAQTVEPDRAAPPLLRGPDGAPASILCAVADEADLGAICSTREEAGVLASGWERVLHARLGTQAPALGHVAGLRAHRREARAAPLRLSDALELGIAVDRLAAALVAPPAGGEGRARGGRSPATLDLDLLARAARHERLTRTVDEARAALTPHGVDPSDAEWRAVRGETASWAEAAAWVRIVRDGPAPDEAAGPAWLADPALEAVVRRVAAGAADGSTGEGADDGAATLIGACARAGGVSRAEAGRALRRALAGRSDGPPLVGLVAAIGAQESVRRMRVAAAGGGQRGG